MQWRILTLFGFVLVSCAVGWLNPLAADVFDDFDSPTLNPNLWEMKQV